MRILLVIFLVMLALPARGKNADRAEELFRSATAPGVSIEEKARLLEESLAEARSYTAAFELGRTYNSLGMPEKAIIAFEQAAAVTLDPAQKSNALTIVARLYKATGDTRAAAEACRRALGIQSSTEVERELRDLEKENSGTVEAAEIAGTLKRGLAKRSLGVQPSIDLRVTFALDSARLSSEGVRQVNELGKALADSSFAAYRIKLVGHTDKRGSDPYNDKLSRQRAEAVKEYLVRTFGITPARLLVEGKGKRELLFMGDDEEDHALNRRVEVVLVE